MNLTKRAIASRANGRLSRGPITEEGKRKASLNGLRHGLLSKNIVLPGESKEMFEALLNQYVDKLRPADGAEFTYVEELAASAWRQRRLWAVENRLWSDALAEYPDEDHRGSITAGLKDLARGPELALLQRYEARLSNAHQRALNNFFLLASLDCQANLDPDNSPAVKPIEPVSKPEKLPDPPQNPPQPAEQSEPEASSPSANGGSNYQTNLEFNKPTEIKPVEPMQPLENPPDSSQNPPAPAQPGEAAPRSSERQVAEQPESPVNHDSAPSKKPSTTPEPIFDPYPGFVVACILPDHRT